MSAMAEIPMVRHEHQGSAVDTVVGRAGLEPALDRSPAGVGSSAVKA
ncbi:hypothetical protein BH92_19165 [Rhodococcoides fascians A21d2]|nr:hypothetical protein [Rhodococcus fascians]QII01707.1 hypothetical protein BH92_19165 [Rhodococcus fascians A21d2]